MTSPEADVCRELIAPAAPFHPGWLLKRSALGITVIAVAGWIWRWNERRNNAERIVSPPRESAANGSGGQTRE